MCKNYTEGITYLKAELHTKADTVCDKIAFIYKVINILMVTTLTKTRLVHNKTSVELAENATTPLLVISPSQVKLGYLCTKQALLS